MRNLIVRHLVFVTMAVCSSLSSLAAAQPEKPPADVSATKKERVTILPNFRKGETVEYDLTLSDKPTDPKLGPPNIPVTVTILEANENETIVEWRTSAPKAIVDAGGQNDAIADMFKLVVQTRIDHKEKNYVLHNTDEVKAFMKRTTDRELERHTARGIPAERVERARRAYAMILEDPQLLQATAMKQPALWITPLWQAGIIGESEASESQMPNPVGDGLINVTRTTTVTREDESGLLRFRVVNEPKREEFIKAIIDFIDRGEKPFTDKEKQEMLAKPPKYIVENEFVVDPATGWLESLVIKSEYSHERGSQKDERRLVRRRETSGAAPKQ